MKKVMLSGAVCLISLHAQDTVIMLDKLQDKLKAEAQAIQVMAIGRTVKGAPYSAQAVNESTQVLADGNRIARSNTSMIYRDSQGRERREELSSAGVVQSISITDPVEGTRYLLRTDTKVAVKTSVPKAIAVNSPNGKIELKTQLDTFVRDQVDAHVVTDIGTNVLTYKTELDNNKEEDLGTQVVQGISATGTRRTTTVPAGSIGNDLPIVTVSERWMSPELKVLVSSTRTDPRTGTTTYKLTNVNRNEPSPSLFQVPPDYTVTDGARRGVVVKEDQ